jgi:hypothetical protein
MGFAARSDKGPNRPLYPSYNGHNDRFDGRDRLGKYRRQRLRILATFKAILNCMQLTVPRWHLN